MGPGRWRRRAAEWAGRISDRGGLADRWLGRPLVLGDHWPGV